MQIEDDLTKLINNLPIFLQERIRQHILKNELFEIILDLGKRPEARFSRNSEYLSQKIISWQDLEYTTKRLSKFSNENRAGIDRTLHRISAIRNRQFLITGLTCRIGRSIFGTISVVKDILHSQKSILILGKPGVGKTTVIREIARVLADELSYRVIIIDTSNEIGGDSNIPHTAIGQSRRMQVAEADLQHQIMIEAVENHMPEIIIIDEIGTELEVLAAQTIAEKGVQLIGTTHGNCLENLIKNPPLANLIGGIQYVILSDEESRRRGTQKSILERKASPPFKIILELQASNLWVIHENVKSSVDLFLLNHISLIQFRMFIINEIIYIKCQRFYNIKKFVLRRNEKLIESNYLLNKSWLTLNQISSITFIPQGINKLKIYPYSLPSNLLREILLKLEINFIFTNDIKQADLIIGLKKYLQLNLRLKIVAKKKKIPIYTVNKLNFYQLAKLFYLINQDNFTPL